MKTTNLTRAGLLAVAVVGLLTAIAIGQTGTALAGAGHPTCTTTPPLEQQPAAARHPKPTCTATTTTPPATTTAPPQTTEPPVTTEPPATTTAPPSSTAPPATTPPASDPPEELPITGPGQIVGLVLAGLAIAAAGGGLLVWSRLRRRKLA